MPDRVRPPALPPGESPSASRAFRAWMLRTFPGRALLAGGVVKLVVWLLHRVAPTLPAPLEALDMAAGLALVFAAAYGLSRATLWARRRLLWRVRRKLILSYVFVGLVPSLLIVTFFLLAGLLLFFNVSSYLVQSRIRTLADQASFVAQSTMLEVQRAPSSVALDEALERRQAGAAERYPFLSVAVVPVKGLTCPPAPGQPARVSRAINGRLPLVAGPWQHLPAPAALPDWITCDGFAGLLAYDVRGAGEGATADPTRLVMRAVVVPEVASPEWAVVVDLPVTVGIEERLREETGIRLGEVTALPFAGGAVRLPAGRPVEDRPHLADASDTTFWAPQWVAFLDYFDWESGASSNATVAIRINVWEIYDRISTISSTQVGSMTFGQLLLAVLALVGTLFLIIQGVALVIGFVLARQITGAVHDLFTGTQHLRNRDFTHQIPVRARDQLGELAESFNLMTHEVTALLREVEDKGRLEQEMYAAREIQQKLLPSGQLLMPGLAINAFCEPAREVAGDYYDFLPITDTMLGVLIADVSGKGLAAGLYMAQLKVIVQSLARVHHEPREFLIAINRVIAANIDSKSFITMSYAVIDLERREMTFARAGHCPTILVRGDQPPGLRKAELLAPDGLVLGLNIDDGQMFDAMLQETTVPLAAGDVIVFFTDGISETMNEAFDCFGEPRLARVIEEYAHLPFEQLRSYISAELRAFAGQADQHDDMTMVLLRVDQVAAAAPTEAV
ncbi:MAG: PP2C family protein-serine/threonine phosphatase [Vicinamibacterales bacterium]